MFKTKGHNKLALLLPRADYLKRSLWNNGAKLRNSLQPELLQAQSLSKVKYLLRLTDLSRVKIGQNRSRDFGLSVTNRQDRAVMNVNLWRFFYLTMAEPSINSNH